MAAVGALLALLVCLAPAEGKSVKLSHDFGTVWRGAILQKTFRITAPQNRTITIRRARTSCGCLHVTRFPASISAGTDADIVLTLDTSTLAGKVSFTAYIETDVSKMRLIKIKTQANVTSLLTVTPAAVDFGENPWGSQSPSVLVQLSQATPTTPRIITVSTDHPGVKATLTEPPSNLARKHPITLRVELGDDCAAGNIRAKVIVRLDDTRQPTISIPVSGKVLGPVEVTPEAVDFGTVSRRRKLPGKQTLRLARRPGAPTFRVSRLEATPNGFLAATLTEDVPGDTYTISLKLLRIPPWPTLEGKLSLRTDAPGQATITIPVQGRFED